MSRFVQLLLLLCLTACPSRAESFEYQVRHHHLFKDCRGMLRFDAEGVEYRTAHTPDARRWKFEQIRVLELSSSQRIELVTYEDQKRYFGKDRVFEFILTEGSVKGDLASFLLLHQKRPMVLAVLPEDGKPAFEFPVKHLRAVTGAMGMLKIYEDRVVFQTDRNGDSRLWRISDIERFSQPDRYRFQIVSYLPKTAGPSETYDFQLLEDLPEGVYDYLWERLHPSSYYPLKTTQTPKDKH